MRYFVLENFWPSITRYIIRWVYKFYNKTWLNYLITKLLKPKIETLERIFFSWMFITIVYILIDICFKIYWRIQFRMSTYFNTMTLSPRNFIIYFILKILVTKKIFCFFMIKCTFFWSPRIFLNSRWNSITFITNIFQNY